MTDTGDLIFMHLTLAKDSSWAKQIPTFWITKQQPNLVQIWIGSLPYPVLFKVYKDFQVVSLIAVIFLGSGLMSPAEST